MEFTVMPNNSQDDSSAGDRETPEWKLLPWMEASRGTSMTRSVTGLNGKYRGSLNEEVGNHGPSTTLVLRIEFSNDPARSVVSGDLFANEDETKDENEDGDGDENGDENGFLWSYISTGISKAEKNGKTIYLCTMNAMPDPHLDLAHIDRLASFNNVRYARIVLEPSQDKQRIDVRMTPIVAARVNRSLPELSFSLERISEYYRTVRVSRFVSKRIAKSPPLFRSEETPTGSSPFGPLTVEDAFEAAGIELVVDDEPSVIDATLAGDDLLWSDAELHNALVEPPAADTQDWKVRFLIARKSEHKENPSGIMFDQTGLSRQGVAIFADRIDEITKEKNLNDAPSIRRQYLYTAIHELGHAFNLPHSFQQHLWTIAEELNRPAALSWMNYPSKYPFGLNTPFLPDKSKPSKTWEESGRGFERFFEALERRLDGGGDGAKVPLFDDVELRHLHHARYQHIVMGGKWSVDDGGAMSQEPPSHDLDVALSVETTDSGGPGWLTVSALEPINLYLRLANLTGQSVKVPSSLAPGLGATTLSVKRSGETTARRFRPILSACGLSGSKDLPANERVYAEISPMFGADGWYMRDPGVYEIQAICTMPDGRRIASHIKKIEIRRLQPQIERRYETKFYDSDLGLLIALDGSPHGRFDSEYRLLDEMNSVIELGDQHRQQLRLMSALRKTRVFKRPQDQGPAIVPVDGRAEADTLLEALGVKPLGEGTTNGEFKPPYKGANLRWTSAARRAANALARHAISEDGQSEGWKDFERVVEVVRRFLGQVRAPGSANDDIEEFQRNWETIRNSEQA